MSRSTHLFARSALPWLVTILASACGGDTTSSPAKVVESDFSLQFTITAPPQAGGTQGTVGITVNPVNGFTEDVSLNIEGLPSGTTTQPALPVTIKAGATQTLTLVVPRGAEAKTFDLTLRGTSSSKSHATTAQLAVARAADFDIAVVPGELNLRPGTQQTATITVSTTNGFTDTVTVALQGLPTGVTVTPASLSIAPGRAAQLTVAASAAVPIGAYSLRVRGATPATSHDAAIALAVIPAAWAHRVGTQLILDRVENNDSIRIVTDLSFGGTITEASLAGVNYLSAVPGSRGIQTSVFEGSANYDDCRTCSSSFGFNPTQEGDKLGHGSPVTASDVANNTLYVKTTPLEWDPSSKSGAPGKGMVSDIILEQWVRTMPGEPRAFGVRYRITHTGSDVHLSAMQWLPALHAAAPFSQLVRYAGTAPWTNGPVTSTTWPVAPTATFATSEHWAAWSDAGGNGITLFLPQDYAGMRARRDAAGVSRITSIGVHGFRPNESFETEGFLVLGDVSTARQILSRLRTSITPSDPFSPATFLDTPAPQTQTVVTGTLNGGGWAVDNTQVSRIDITVDGKSAVSAAANLFRADLSSIYPGVSANNGFSFSLDTRTLADGAHDVIAVVSDPSGNQTTSLPGRIIVNNGGQSGPLSVDVATGNVESVFDGHNGPCTASDIFDMPARAVHTGDGSVLFAAVNAPANYFLRGPDLNHLGRSCTPVLVSPQKTDAQSFQNWYWIASLYRLGNTIHAVVHNEYHDPAAANCKAGDTSPANPCWYNALLYASSTDDGRSFTMPDTPNHIVAAPPEIWDPNAPGLCGGGYCPHYGYEGGTNIVKGPDGAYYEIFSAVPGAVVPGRAGACVMRTTNLSDPSSWRAWDGVAFTVRMASPYLPGASGQACAFIDSNAGGFSSSLTYNTYLQRYLLVGILVNVNGFCGVGYSLSSDLVHWTKYQPLYQVPLAQPGCQASASSKIGSTLYPSVLDPSDTSVNFEQTGQHPYLYLTRWTGTREVDREVIRVPLTFTKR